MSAILYKAFKTRHPEYDAEYWAKCRALYAGGKKLLGDAKLLEKLFPRHLAEEDDVYTERKRRAFYIPYAGQIVDYIVAALRTDPLVLGDENQPAPEAFADFAQNVSREGSPCKSLNEILGDVITTALQTQRAWVLVDLPPKPTGEDAPITVADEEAAGLTAPYAIEVEPERVLDWEKDDAGRFLWALIYRQTRARAGLEQVDRNRIREEWTLYTATDWKRYAIEYTEGKDEPKDDTPVPLVDENTHSFGCVPLIPLELPDGLAAMNKIESLAAEHFNRRAAASWAQYRSCFQFLAFNLSAPDPLNPVSEDSNRGVNQRIGPGRGIILAEKDKVAYVAPDSGPFDVVLRDLAALRDEMMRVLHHMALSVDNSGAALQRSAASKQVDQSSTVVVLKALGNIMREFAEDMIDVVAAGRGEEFEPLFRGLDEFNISDLGSLSEEAAVLETISIPSETFHRQWKLKIAKCALGNASDPILEAIERELQKNITAESVVPPDPLELKHGPPGDGGDGEDDPAKAEDDNKN